MKYLSLTIPGVDEPIQGPAELPTGGFLNSSTGNDIVGLVLGLVFVAAVIITLFLIIYGGIQWMLSRGDKEKLTAARMKIVWAIVGLVVIVLSVMIVNLLLYFLGGTPILSQNATFSCQALNETQCTTTPECVYISGACANR